MGRSDVHGEGSQGMSDVHVGTVRLCLTTVYTSRNGSSTYPLWYLSLPFTLTLCRGGGSSELGHDETSPAKSNTPPLHVQRVGCGE